MVVENLNLLNFLPLSSLEKCEMSQRTQEAVHQFYFRLHYQAVDNVLELVV